MHDCMSRVGFSAVNTYNISEMMIWRCREGAVFSSDERNLKSWRVLCCGPTRWPRLLAVSNCGENEGWRLPEAQDKMEGLIT